MSLGTQFHDLPSVVRRGSSGRKCRPNLTLDNAAARDALGLLNEQLVLVGHSHGNGLQPDINFHGCRRLRSASRPSFWIRESE